MKSIYFIVVLLFAIFSEGCGGNENGNAQKLATEIRARFPEYDPKVTIIGHLQRGGAPSALDRLIASRMGYKAVEAVIEGHTNKMVGIQNNQMKLIPFEDAINKSKDIDQDLLRMDIIQEGILDIYDMEHPRAIQYKLETLAGIQNNHSPYPINVVVPLRTSQENG